MPEDDDALDGVNKGGKSLGDNKRGKDLIGSSGVSQKPTNKTCRSK